MNSMDRVGKKSVRFSSPFESDQQGIPSLKDFGADNFRRSCNAISSDTESISGDSWDAFDAKMLKSKVATPKVVEHQFLELSSVQNKSLTVREEDFSSLSFQDAKGLIEKDENERLQFMNSNISFSEGLDQVEAPSLLSFTTYFQQGSSFPVPYVGNESTMMFGETLPGISLSEQPTQPQHSNNKRHSHSGQSINRLSSRRDSTASFNDFLPMENSELGKGEKPDLSRNDSLAKFFLGPQSNGMNKNDIMEYVLDYCKRRASCRLSDVSEISPVRKSNEKTPDRHDSGIGFGIEDKTVIDLYNKKSKTSAVKQQQQTVTQEVAEKENKQAAGFANQLNKKARQDESIVIANGYPMKNGGGGMLDLSVDGFEKFKKNLDPRRRADDRYRRKQQNHLEFEKKRLTVDERNSHPRLSPKAFSGPGATASLERPHKKMTCSSPPEKLSRSKSENTINDTPPDTGLGQCHSTPVASESCVSKAKMTSIARRSNKPSPLLDERVEKPNEHMQGKQTATRPNRLTTFTNDCPEGLQDSNNAKLKENSTTCKSSEDTSSKSDNDVSCTLSSTKALVQVQPNHYDKPEVCNSYDSMKMLKASNFLPEGLSIMPIIHSGSGLQQHLSSTPQCACPHQCGQQSSHGGMTPGVSGVPIVIHIHLPCAPPTTGTVVHPVPNSSTDNRK